MSRLSRFLQLKHITYKLNTRFLATTVKDEIIIPKRIDRGPTDILQALEVTVKRDNNSPHYKFHDDPFLIPNSNMGKRSFAMAQESGRKAAHWVRHQHPELFMHSEAEPPIKAFLGKKLPDEKDLKESDLIAAINDVNVSDAISIYKSLIGNGVQISDENRQSLLELLCFYNSKDTIDAAFIEERWFKQSEKGKERQRKTWTDGMLSEEIFIGIENPNGEAYSALIQGMAKYYQVDRAWQLFQEAQEKNLTLNVESFNAIIGVVNLIMESYEKRWTLILDLLNRMRLLKLKPNINTLNGVLDVLGTMGTGRNIKEYALQTLAEFKQMGVEPSLGSWCLMLIIFCKDRGPISTILYDIMNEIQDKEFKIRHIKDTNFFVTAMDVCRRHLHDKYLAKRVYDLLLFGNNYDLIGDSFKESIFYRNYCILMCETEPIENFMQDIYFKFVPNIYVPEPGVMEEVLNMILLNSATNYLPKLWSDIKIFDMNERENLLKLVTEIMIKNETEELKANFSDIAWEMFSVPEERKETHTSRLTFTAEMLSDLITILLRNNEFEKSTIIMDKLYGDHHNVMGVPKITSMISYLDHCIKEKLPSKAIMCIQYCFDCGFPEVDEMVTKLTGALTLNEKDLEKLSRISTKVKMN
ncbi:small ribosomal subunit protein mS39 [Onthophagus taurus]|uniref:small ribosomal subunit protein mS39 n=1 Tax=Onthophagus taurus TaxID=166361 RepID=UPI0039BDB90E